MLLKILIISICFFGCSTHYMTNTMLIDQIKSSPDSVLISKTRRDDIFNLKNKRGEIFIKKTEFRLLDTSYFQNHDIAKLYCFGPGQRLTANSSDGKAVSIKIDARSQIWINKDSDAKFEAYLANTCLIDSVLYGYKSRFLMLKRSIGTGDIKVVEIGTEF